MVLSPSWTHSWSASDDGSTLGGADLGNIQADIATALAKAFNLTDVNTFTGSGIPYRTIVLTPGGAILPSSNGAGRTQTDGTNLSYLTLDFDQSTDEKAYWIFRVPS